MIGLIGGMSWESTVPSKGMMLIAIGHKNKGILDAAGR
jgi:aspartate/glutamate racemase